jgi:hypothetical protein
MSLTVTSRSVWRTVLRGIAAACIVSGAMAALSTTPASAARSNYWTRLVFWDGNTSPDNLYLTNVVGQDVFETVRWDIPGQAWHVTDVPGLKNAVQLHSGMNADGSMCLSFDNEAGSMVIDTENCGDGYATFWVRQFTSSGTYQLANTQNGLCISERPDIAGFGLVHCGAGAIYWTETN